MNRRLEVALVVAVAPISPASAADVGEILIEVGHSADVYGVTNNYGEVLSGGFPRCLLPTQTRKPRVPRGDPQRRGAAASCTSAEEAHQSSDAESSGQDRRLMARGGASRKAVNFQFLYYIYIARETLFCPTHK